jgi:hypothetical protein
MSGMFMLLQKLPFDGKRQIRLSTLSKLTTGNAFRLQWYQNHSNFHSVILDHVVCYSIADCSHKFIKVTLGIRIRLHFFFAL